MTEHEWLRVGARRWCLCCEAFQTLRPPDGKWWPLTVPEDCPMTSPYADRKMTHGAAGAA